MENEIEKFLNDGKISETQWSNYRSPISNALKYFNERNITEPTTEDLAAYAEYLQTEKKNNDLTVKKYIGRIKKFLEWKGTGTKTMATIDREEKQVMRSINFQVPQNQYKLLKLLALDENTTVTGYFKKIIEKIFEDNAERIVKLKELFNINE